MAFDLDEEELEATKKLNKVDKRIGIEDIIKKLRKVVKESRIEFEDFGSLLVAYADLDLIEEMANQLELFHKGELYTAKQIKNTEKNQNKYFINKQKIREKIEELDIEILECEYADSDTEEYKKDIEKEKKILLIKKSILQEFLEEK